MSYVEPTAETFKARFPEFGGVSDALVSAVLDESFSLVGDNWHEDDRAKAQQLWTAHTLSMEGEPQRSATLADGGTVDNAQSGSVTSMKVGDVSVTYGGRSRGASASGSGSMEAEYRLTNYGARFYELMMRNISSVFVT